MIGAIIGDIVGARFEFGEAPEKGFELFTSDHDCSYTDDTVCTIAVADAILNHRHYAESLRNWCRRYPDPIGSYGGMFEDWVKTDDAPAAHSWGNGAAMRISPVGWLFNDFHEVLDEAKAAASCSHDHPEAIRGAQCVATLIYWLRTQRIRKDQVEAKVKERFGYEIPPLDEINQIGRNGHFDSSCQETVPWAIRCFLESDNFEDAIRLAVMADGDTDTKANITGAIAEASYDIPERLIDEAICRLPNDILTVMDQFCERVIG